MTKVQVHKSCCAPARATHSFSPTTTEIANTAALRVASDAILLSGANALVGTRMPEIPDDGEDPVRETRVKPFRIGATTVTNAQFSEFINATGYVTEAERFGWSFVFWAQVSMPSLSRANVA
jgi:formylglycine-generating enzyme